MKTTNKKNPENAPSKTPMIPIAIIGMAGILPKAENIQQYWDNILNEVNCISEVPPSRWDVNAYYDPDPNVPDKTYSKYGGFIPDVQFDPTEFGLPPNILEVTDVSQLLSLLVARDALKDAGYGNATDELLDRTGVILGMVGMSSKVIHPLLCRLQYPLWEKVLKSSSVPENEIPDIIEKMKLAYVGWNENAFPGSIGNVVAGRIANRLNLGGTNCIVDAACGSSLAAVKMAVSELVEGRAHMMITGGVDTDNSILTYMCFSKTPAFSKGDRLRAFDADSDGMLTGEGIGMLVLKRLADAERDHNRIYAVIRGIGTSSDGHYKSIYAPRASGQAKAVRRAYEEAGFSHNTVSLIEAHGTGTGAGDPAEFEGLREAFGNDNPRRQYVALGSVKSQIGHTKATAGTASLLKAALALHHKALPATINVSQPQPKLDIENSPFYLNTETRPWFFNPVENPRRAGVSSFGFGGTNFHVILEEYSHEHEGAYRLQSTPYTILLSAPDVAQLIEQCQQALLQLNSDSAFQFLDDLESQSQTTPIPQHFPRIGVVVESLDDARECIQLSVSMLKEKTGVESWEHPKGIYYRSAGVDPVGKTVALFPGQGSQYVGMGKELAINFPTIRKAFELTNSLFDANGRAPITDVVYPIPVFTDEKRNEQQALLTNTLNAQPAIGTFSMGIFNLLSQAGFKADFCAGHSFGELTALWAAGAIDTDAFLNLAKLRGEAMSTPAAPDQELGSMLAVKGDTQGIQEVVAEFKDITIANFNSNSQVVLAGSKQAVADIKTRLEEKKFAVYPLSVSAAFHTSFVKHAQKPFAQAIKNVTFHKPKITVFSNTSAQAYDGDPEKISQTLAEHILKPVLFKDEIENIYAKGGSIFIEVGPKNVLTNLVKDILKDKPHSAIALNPNPKANSDLQYRQAVLQMRVLGFPLTSTDPYKIYQDHTPKKYSKVTVTLNGGLYMTEDTRSKFENALKAGTPDASRHEVHKTMVTSQVTNMNIESLSLDTLQAKPNDTSIKSMESITSQIPSMNSDLDKLLEEFQQHQRDLLKTHELYLNNDISSKKIIGEIVQNEMSILSKLNGNFSHSGDQQALAALDKRAEFINQQQTGTAQVHLEYIKSQSEFAQQYATLLQNLMSRGSIVEFKSAPKPIHEQPVTLPQAVSELPTVIEKQTVKPPVKEEEKSAPENTIGQEQLSQVFLSIVSEKTGYPCDMLEMGMDMEADLGIDSIKRVEILGAMQERFPHLPAIPPEELSELHTLEQILKKFGSTDAPTSVVEEPQEKEQNTVSANEEKSPAAGQTDSDEIHLKLLEVVSEKTGYPGDMLEMGMDLEADLGIDSIKRVEILGAMKEYFPNLPEVGAEELAQLHTLEQIIQKLNSTSLPADAVEQNPQASKNITEQHTSDEEVRRLSVTLKYLPPPDYLEFNPPDESLCLITNDGSERISLLAESFTTKGWKVALLNLLGINGKNTASLPKDVQHFDPTSADEQNIQKTLEEIISHYGKLSIFIHLDPLLNGKRENHIEFSEQKESLLKNVFLIARHLKKPLLSASKNGRAAFITITQMDGQFGLEQDTFNDPLSGGLFGLVKTLRLEWNGVFCRALDFHPNINPASAVKLIEAELHDPNLNLSEVGYTTDGRYTLALSEKI